MTGIFAAGVSQRQGELGVLEGQDRVATGI